MKLELKHLAPYLPYGLRIEMSGMYQYDIVTLMALREGQLMDKESQEWYPIDQDLKPILRSLSDLHNVIEVNRERFIPAVKSGMETSKYPDKLKEWPNYMREMETNKRVQMFIEWHFDVFGLIEAGLAIPIKK